MWYGEPYAAWSTHFVGFCMQYADAGMDVVPFESDPETWIDALRESELFTDTDSPEALPTGSLLFYRPADINDTIIIEENEDAEEMAILFDEAEEADDAEEADEAEETVSPIRAAIVTDASFDEEKLAIADLDAGDSLTYYTNRFDKNDFTKGAYATIKPTTDNPYYKPTGPYHPQEHEKTQNPTETADYYADTMVDDEGYLVFTGLGIGEYTITETEAPKGYNILTDAIKVEFTFDVGDEEFKAKVDDTEKTVTDGVVVVEVVNNKGTVLPTTGGSGTILLIVLGSMLFMATAVVLVTKKRMYNEG